MAGNKVYITLEVTDKGTAVVRGFDKNTEQAFNKMKANARASTASMGTSLQKLRQHWLPVTAAMTGVVLAARKVINAASDLQEVNSKFNVVFADQISLAEKWAEQLVDSYAMSTRESKQFLASIQDLLVPMGMARDAAGRMSFEVVKLAADLGSFNNLPTAQVMADIQSGLVGNYETMKKYGVVLNATVVQEKALAMGLAASKKELTAAQKAHAAYTLMVEGSEAAIGDMARTSEGYANQMKTLKARMEDLAATIATPLLPRLADLLGALNKIAESAHKVFGGETRDYAAEMLEDYRKRAVEIKDELLMIKQQLKDTATWRLSSDDFTEWLKTTHERTRQLYAELALVEKKIAFLTQPKREEPGTESGGGLTDTGTETMKEYIKKAKEAAAILNAPPFDWEEWLPPVNIKDEMADYVKHAKEMAAIEYAEPFDYEQWITGYDAIEEKGTQTFDNLKNAVTGWGATFSAQLNDMLWDADTTFADILESFGRMISQMVIQKKIVEPILGSEWFKALGSAHGNIFQNGSIIPYGRGGIINRPTIFPMANGAGLMGEKGPEGVLPLTRTRSGDLGVKTEGAHPNVEINMINQSSQGLQATHQGSRSAAGKHIIDVVIKDLQRGGALRQVIRSTI